VSVRTGVWFFPDVGGRAVFDTIVAAETLGVDEVWLGDEGPARDPFVLLGAAAMATDRVLLGIAVTNPYLRHPATIAASALTVHELSGGRMILGIGAGGDLALKPAQVERVNPLAATRRAVRIIRAVCDQVETEGYTPAPHAFTAPPLKIYVGARSEKLNRFASESADGTFIAGVPQSSLPSMAGWATSVHPIEVAIYCDAVFDGDAAVEARRPRWIYNMLNGPDETRARFGISLADASAAAEAFTRGDEGPARKLVTDRLLDELVMRGTPEQVGRELAARVRPFNPTSVGLTLFTADPVATLEPAAAALAVARKELD
jgi:5,10-methylenetetrahydromethanopterin reductase